ncbi:CMRF35-like molecule 8 isoform X2 [Megalobrama amblycephala]|uniref:CMRF35-like molecule 8 isoform X2 n=1 Tax=Megalobrama amblycephala TaxID=75352 RepID=UPI00201481BB|nr:CMRF35-like molecule 8 isoform X2 [Megalobrama amblycephala]
MWDVLLLFSSICTAVVVEARVTVTGYRGERVDIRCPYESGYESNPKYFCRGECLLITSTIVKTGSPAQDERFSLIDDKKKRVFTVTITDLSTEDEGKYWCVVERPLSRYLTLTDIFSEMFLKVKLDRNATEVSTISSFSVRSESEMNPSSRITDHQISSIGSDGITVTAEALVLLLIAVPLIIESAGRV